MRRPPLVSHAMIASRTVPTLCVLVMPMGPSRNPPSVTHVVPVISPLPLYEYQLANTGSRLFLPSREHDRHARAHRSLADNELALAGDERGVADLDAGDVGDGVEPARRAADRECEIALSLVRGLRERRHGDGEREWRGARAMPFWRFSCSVPRRDVGWRGGASNMILLSVAPPASPIPAGGSTDAVRRRVPPCPAGPHPCCARRRHAARSLRAARPRRRHRRHRRREGQVPEDRGAHPNARRRKLFTVDLHPARHFAQLSVPHDAHAVRDRRAEPRTSIARRSDSGRSTWMPG